MEKESLNENEQLNQCHPELDSGSPKDHLRRRLSPQDLNRDAECPQHDKRGSESGRTLVEMLGVLAIVGLLTIIGIAGFKIAMNKAKANNLVADMNRLAHIVVMDKFSGYSEEAIERAVTEHNEKTEYQAEYEYRTPQVFAIKTKNKIDRDICQQLANLGWQLPLATYLNKVKVEGTFDADSCADENELIWAFTNDLSACPDCPLGDFDCTPYANRECGTCDSIEYTPRNEDCVNNANGQYCVNGKCRACDTNQAWNRNTGTCESCSIDSREIPTIPEYTQACVGTMMSSYYQGDRLIGCHAPFIGVGESDLESCKACDNRCYNPNDRGCQAFGENLPAQSKATDGTCVCNRSSTGACICPSGQFWDDIRNQCTDNCDTNQAWNRNTGTCESCSIDSSEIPTIAEYTQACVGTMLSSYYGGDRLFGCNSSYNEFSNSEPISCGACHNRCYNPSNQYCYRTGEGQAHQRVSDDDGTCVAN